MAGQEIVKSTKSSFVGVSPKSKQASILNFFGSQKQGTPISSSPLKSSIESNLVSEYLEDSEKVMHENFDHQPECLHASSRSKKQRFSSKNHRFTANFGENLSISTPKILSQLSIVANSDFEQSDSSYGRYPWLVNIKDIDGNKIGNCCYCE